MGSGDRPVNDVKISVRLPEPLVILLEMLNVRHCRTMSDTLRDLLETHPVVVYMADRVYAVGDSPPDGKVTSQT